MKNIYLFLICVLMFLSFNTRAQNAPVTTAQKVVTAIPGNNVIIPVIVDGFADIGTFALTLDYDPGVITFLSSGVNPAVGGLTVNNGTPGRITIMRSSSAAATLSDGSTLVSIVFQYLSGTTVLEWYDDGGSCEYKTPAGTAMTDSPASAFYLNGVVSDRAAPVTKAPVINNAAPGPVTVPITVQNFSNIGSIDLVVEYDPLVLTYSGYLPHASVSTGFTVSNQPGIAGKNNLVMQWSGGAVNLADESVLVNLYFTYGYENGFSYSILKWINVGSACEFADADAGSLWDEPASDYYLDGLVADQVSPISYIPEITNAVPGTVWIPVIIEDFNNIGGISLTYVYDPDIITYASEYTTPVEGLFVSNQTLPNGNNKITIGRFGTATTMDDGDTLVNIRFNYTGATSTLFFMDNGESCEFTDEAFNPLLDYPMEEFYHHGLITDQLAPVTHLPSLTLATTGNCQVPVTTNGFEAIRSFNLQLEFDPEVLTFVNITPNINLAGSFSAGSTLPGILSIQWNGISDVTLADGSQLFLLIFNYSNGSTSLVWNDDENGCEYKNTNSDPLYDQPEADYYYHGIVTDQYAPVSILPEYTIAIPGTIWLPVTVEDFEDITSLMLTFSYDPEVITYENEFSSTVPGLAIGNQLQENGTGLIIINRIGQALDLDDGDTLVILKFNYLDNATSLTWLDDGPSCQFRDNTNFPLHDQPFADYFDNGNVLSEVAPIIIADSVSAGTATWITLPVRVYNFTEINSFSLTLDYNPDVAVFDCATPHTSLAGSFYASATTPGRLEIGWFDVERTLADGSVLVYIRFAYLGGSTDMIWYNSGASCDFTTGDLYLPLYDLPTTYFYKNGKIVDYEKWTGAVSSEWNTAGNWELGRVPGELTNSMISDTPAPSNWPEFNGNFETGLNCNSLAIAGNAQMHISGNLKINPRSTLLFDGSGTLKLDGNWACFGTFLPGNGNIEFTGQGDSQIESESYTGGLAGYSLTTFPAGMTPIAGATSFLTGDNAHVDINIGFDFSYLGQTYYQLRINTNGWVSLNKSGSDASSMHNANLFTTQDPSTVLAPWWDNLKADGSTSISYTTFRDKITIEWKNILSYSASATARLNFQLILYQNSGIIEFHYGTVTTGTHSSSESASIGIKDATGGMGHFIDVTSATMNNTTTCLVSPSGWPLVNYRFTPFTSNTAEEVFNKVTLSKTNGKLNIGKNIRVTGVTQ